MLTRSDIRKMTVSTTYQRGMGIYIQAGKIRTFDVETDMVNPELDNIRAVVRGSGRSCYDVDISYNTAADDVEYGYCSCPAFENYRGPCKHCVAVLLEYADHQQGKPLRVRGLSAAGGPFRVSVKGCPSGFSL